MCVPSKVGLSCFFLERGDLFFLGLMEDRDSNLFLPRVEVGPFLLGG